MHVALTILCTVSSQFGAPNFDLAFSSLPCRPRAHTPHFVQPPIGRLREPRPKSPNHHLSFPRIIPRHNSLVLGCTSCRLHQSKSIPRPSSHLPDSMPAPDRTVPTRSAPVTCVASASLDVPSISPVNPVFYVAFKVPIATIKRKQTRMLRS